MFCNHCGKQIPDESNVCPYCGTNLINKKSTVNNADDSAKNDSVNNANTIQLPGLNEQGSGIGFSDADKEKFQQGVKTASEVVGKGASKAGEVVGSSVNKAGAYIKDKYNDPKSKKTVTLIGICIALALCFIIYLAIKPTSINMKEMVDLNLNGANGKATINPELSSDHFVIEVLHANGLLKDYDNLEYVSGSDYEALQKNDQLLTDIEHLADSIKITADPDSNLSNSDSVELVVAYNKELAKKCKISLKATKFNYSVSGLADLQEYDPFANISIEFSGVSPHMSATISGDGTDQLGGYYSLNKSDDIAIGDVITVSYSLTEDEANSQGYTLASTSKDITVSEGAKYLDSANEVDEDVLQKMEAAASDTVNAYTASSDTFGSEGYTKTTEPVYEGMYFLKSKDASSTGQDNIAYVVMSIWAEGYKDSQYYDTSIYFPVEFDNLSIYSGDISYESNDTNLRIAGNSRLPAKDYGWESVEGYISVETMYNELLASKVNAYVCEETDDIKTLRENSGVAASTSENALGEIHVLINNLNIRSAADKNSQKLQHADPNVTYYYYETTENNGYTWYRIGNNMWIANDTKENWCDVTTY